MKYCRGSWAMTDLSRGPQLLSISVGGLSCYNQFHKMCKNFSISYINNIYIFYTSLHMYISLYVSLYISLHISLYINLYISFFISFYISFNLINLKYTT